MVLALAVAVEGAAGVRVGHGVVGAGDGEGGEGSGGRDQGKPRSEVEEGGPDDGGKDEGDEEVQAHIGQLAVERRRRVSGRKQVCPSSASSFAC